MLEVHLCRCSVCPKDTVSLLSSIASGSYINSASSPPVIAEPQEEGVKHIGSIRENMVWVAINKRRRKDGMDDCALLITQQTGNTRKDLA